MLTATISDSYAIFEQLEKALEAGGYAGRRARTGRYDCPSCGAKGDGHGLHVDHRPDAAPGKRKILVVCHANDCDLADILRPLGITPADICAADGLLPGVATRIEPRWYFDRNGGLLVATLAEDILDMGPLAAGTDNIMWSYQDGVWRADKDVVRSRAVRLLGERYRRAHASNAEDAVRAMSPQITCEPISEVINFRNGLYSWQANKLLPHSPHVMSTVQLTVNWDPAATCPEFDKFLEQVLPADMIEPVWELIGYLMYSGNPLHKAVMLAGTGRNGKGTLLRAIIALLGKENITASSLQHLVSVRFASASLFGKIANIAGDIDGTYIEDTAKFKAITGEDVITAEHKGRDQFDFMPWAVPVFSANKIPPSSDVSIGYLSRWFVVPFPNNFEGREDRGLTERLTTKPELQGIAAKAMPRLRRLMERGDFELSESGKQARDEFTRRVDQVRAWLDECTEPDPGGRVNRTHLYGVYKGWAARDNHKPVKAAEFYDRLEAAGVRQTRVGSKGERVFTGIKVTDTTGH